MAYITLHNLRKISRAIIKDESFQAESIYKREIYFFNQFEKKQLSSLKSLIKNPTELISSFYTPLEGHVDKKEFVFENNGQTNAYHSDKNCRLLNNPYENVRIPKGLKKAGITVEEFRDWFENNMMNHFQNRKYDVIVEAVWYKFNVRVSVQDFVVYENSDNTYVNNYRIEDLEKEIDKRIKDAGRYFYDHKDILKTYSLRTFLAYKEEEIKDNNTGMSDQELKDFLKDYDKRFKEPVKSLLIEWYKIKFNPKMEIKASLLETLNFKPCPCCVGKHHKSEKLNVEAIKDIQLMSKITQRLPVHVQEFSKIFNQKYARA